MRSIFEDFPNKTTDDYIYFLPIDRLMIDYKERVGNLILFPKGYIDIDELFKNHSFLDNSLKYIEILKEKTLVAFLSSSPTNFTGLGINNLKLINYALDRITPVIDFIIFNYCNILNSSILPGRVGQIESGESILLLFHETGSPFTRIIHEKVYTNAITLGNGLIIKESNYLSFYKLLNQDIDEVGNVAKHALRMYTQLVESNSETEKFIQSIRLFEFIASPNKYEKFQNVKAKIISHIAKNITQIHEISEEFKYYSSGSCNDGLRTQIFHNGMKIEELIESEYERKKLFEKLHRYLFACMSDLLCMYNNKWSNLEQERQNKRSIAEKNKVKIVTTNYSDTIVLIDCEFLSESISRYQKLYSEEYPLKKLNIIDLRKLCCEILLNTRRWKDDTLFGFYLFHTENKLFPFVNEAFDEINGKTLKFDNSEILFHSKEFGSEIELFLGVTKILKDLNQNRKVIIDEFSIFETVIFCGDNKHYEQVLKELNDTGSKDIILIRDAHYSEMELEIRYFDVGHLVGKVLGLSNNEI